MKLLHALRPFGELAADLRAAQLCQTIAACAGAKGEKAARWWHVMPEIKALLKGTGEKKAQGMEQMITTARLIGEAFDGKKVR